MGRKYLWGKKASLEIRKEKNAAYQRQYYLKHLEERREYMREYARKKKEERNVR